MLNYFFVNIERTVENRTSLGLLNFRTPFNFDLDEELFVIEMEWLYSINNPFSDRYQHAQGP